MTLEAWCELYSLTGIRQLTSFAGTVMRKMEGIVARASHRISSGVLKGTNTLIKNMRRQAFGMIDFDYFGLLLWEQTHRPNRRRRFRSQHMKLMHSVIMVNKHLYSLITRRS